MTFRVRDSAGVRITASTAPTWSERTAWRLAGSPRVSVGTADGPDNYQISWIWDALLLGDRTLVVANAGGHDVRFYDSVGRFIRSTGRQGAGPGEFGAGADLRIWRLPHGELAVRDAPTPRVNIFDSTGVFRRTAVFEQPPGVVQPAVIGTFPDGSYLTLSSEGFLDGPPGQVSRLYSRLHRFDRDGRLLGTLLRVEMAPHMTHEFGGLRHFPYLPFTVEPIAVVDSLSVLILQRGEPSIDRYDLNGRLIGRIVWHPNRNPITREVYRRLAATNVAAPGDSAQERLWRHYYDQNPPMAEVAPAYQGLYVDETRHLWIERYRLPGEDQRQWDIIDSSGRWLGVVELPGRIWLHRAGRNFVVGTQMDSLDVERVQVYDLDRRQ